MGKAIHVQLELACGEYDLAKEEACKKGAAQRVTIAIIEKRFGLPRGSLQQYRANHLSRSHSPSYRVAKYRVSKAKTKLEARRRKQ